MNSFSLRESILYRYRFKLAYGLFAVVLLAVMTINISDIPYGLSQSEINSAVSSNTLNPLDTHMKDVINLPYHLLQKLSISLLGLSPLSIKLPSLVLALASSVLIALTLRIWFQRTVATIAMLATTISVPFLSMGRSGVPTILYVFLLFIILYSAVRLTSQKRPSFIWKLLVTSAGMLLLYIPFGIYTLLALSIAALLHPHIRFQLRHTKLWQAIILGLICCVLILPHILALISASGAETLSKLFGINAIVSNLAPDTIGKTIVSLLKTLFMFNKPNVSETITPFFNITIMLLIAFGLVKVIAHRTTARSYLVLIWLGFSIPMLLIDSSQLPLLFVPAVLLVALGIETLLFEWYKLFPRNPYARFGAMIPLGLLIISLLQLGIVRYFYAYNYTDTRNVFHPELTAVNALIDDKPVLLVVPSEQLSFYDILRSKHPNIVVSDNSQDNLPMRRIALASAAAETAEPPSHIVASYLQNDGILLRVYDAPKE